LSLVICHLSLVLLIEAQPGSVSRKDEDGNTLLHLAVYHRDRPVVGELLRRGAAVDVRNEMGQKPIHLALYNGMGGPAEMLRDPYLDIAGILLDHGAELDLWIASAIGDVANVCRILQQTPKTVNADNGARRYPGGANYPLGIAALGGHLEIVRLLLEHGANPDIENDNEYRESDQLESGVCLIYHIMRSAYTQVTAETHSRNMKILAMLLDFGVDPNDPDDRRRTSLHHASDALRVYSPDEEALIELVRLLIERGGDIEAVDTDLGTTPLGWAIRYGRFKFARFLIESGANLSPDDVTEEMSPRQLAETYGDDKLRKLMG